LVRLLSVALDRGIMVSDSQQRLFALKTICSLNDLMRAVHNLYRIDLVGSPL
jgi:hypothetical protein